MLCLSLVHEGPGSFPASRPNDNCSKSRCSALVAPRFAGTRSCLNSSGFRVLDTNAVFASASVWNQKVFDEVEYLLFDMRCKF